MPGPRVLWVDDKISDYQAFVDGLADAGLVVETASTVDEGIELARSAKPFSLVLVDLKMPGKTGFAAIQRLRRILPETPMCVLSSYLHLPHYQQRLNRMSRSLGVLAKDLPDPSSDAFQVFVEKLKGFISAPPRYSPRQFEEHFKKQRLEPFQMPFREYMNLPEKLKRLLHDEAQRQAEDALRDAFRSGYVWVLFCGDPTNPVMSAEVEADIPSADEVMSVALEIDRAPYQFSCPDAVDDMWSGNCRGGISERTYPTLTLQLGKEDRDSNWIMHFDTGCPFTVLQYDVLDEYGLLRQDAFGTSGRRGDEEYEYVSQDIRVKLIDQETGSGRFVSFRVRAVKDWRNSPFVAFCPERCEYFSLGEQTICAHRSGLIGRNVLSETGISLTLNGKTNKTSIRGEKDA